MLKKKFVNQPKNLYLLKLAFESDGEIFKNQDLVGNPSPDLFFHKALVLLPCGRIN